jgi:hypothetical protein
VNTTDCHGLSVEQLGTQKGFDAMREASRDRSAIAGKAVRGKAERHCEGGHIRATHVRGDGHGGNGAAEKKTTLRKSEDGSHVERRR